MDHLARVALKPAFAEELAQLQFVKGVQGTAAIEGNTLNEEEVRQRLTAEAIPNRSSRLGYLEREIDNLKAGYDRVHAQLLDKSGDPPTWSAPTFHHLNKILLKDVPLEGDQPGTVSRGPVGVAGYRGAPREDCQHLLERLAVWINEGMLQNNQGLSDAGAAIVRALLAHLYLAWIHPWADGNGRTARLTEYAILLSGGLPRPACHLPSNFYNRTRQRYYDELARTSNSGGDVIPFLHYAVEGLRDALRQMVTRIQDHQLEIAWESYLLEMFRDQSGKTAHRQRLLVEALSHVSAAQPLSKITDLSPSLARLYATKTTKTLSRDVNALISRNLIKRTPDGYIANLQIMKSFIPDSVHSPNIAVTQSPS